jgi:hypothetical protein
MKKAFIFIILAVLLLSTVIVTCLGQDPKVIACEAACEEAKEQCYAKADGDSALEIACDAAETKCKDECNN